MDFRFSWLFLSSLLLYLLAQVDEVVLQVAIAISNDRYATTAEKTKFDQELVILLSGRTRDLPLPYTICARWLD